MKRITLAIAICATVTYSVKAQQRSTSGIRTSQAVIASVKKPEKSRVLEVRRDATVRTNPNSWFAGSLDPGDHFRAKGRSGNWVLGDAYGDAQTGDVWILRNKLQGSVRDLPVIPKSELFESRAESLNDLVNKRRLASRVSPGKNDGVEAEIPGLTLYGNFNRRTGVFSDPIDFVDTTEPGKRARVRYITPPAAKNPTRQAVAVRYFDQSNDFSEWGYVRYGSKTPVKTKHPLRRP